MGWQLFHYFNIGHIYSNARNNLQYILDKVEKLINLFSTKNKLERKNISTEDHQTLF